MLVLLSTLVAVNALKVTKNVSDANNSDIYINDIVVSSNFFSKLYFSQTVWKPQAVIRTVLKSQSRGFEEPSGAPSNQVITMGQKSCSSELDQFFFDATKCSHTICFM